MFINIGNSHVVDDTTIIGVFDLDNTTVSKRGRGFLPNAERTGSVIYTNDDLPQSFVLTHCEQKDKLYITSISPRVLFKRINEKRSIR